MSCILVFFMLKILQSSTSNLVVSIGIHHLVLFYVGTYIYIYTNMYGIRHKYGTGGFFLDKYLPPSQW